LKRVFAPSLGVSVVARLSQTGGAPKTYGSAGLISEAESGSRYLQERGVPASKLFLDTEAYHTLDNAVNAKVRSERWHLPCFSVCNNIVRGIIAVIAFPERWQPALLFTLRCLGAEDHDDHGASPVDGGCDHPRLAYGTQPTAV
jgi:hypothetical protein